MIKATQYTREWFVPKASPVMGLPFIRSNHLRGIVLGAIVGYFINRYLFYWAGVWIGAIVISSWVAFGIYLYLERDADYNWRRIVRVLYTAFTYHTARYRTVNVVDEWKDDGSGGRESSPIFQVSSPSGDEQVF